MKLSHEEESKLHEDIQDGGRADEILKHPFFIQAFDDIQNNLLKQLVTAKTPDKRNETALMLTALQTLRSYFDKASKDGKIAKSRLGMFGRILQKVA